MARRNWRAFTLIELLVVMAIIAMVLALAAPAVMHMMRTTSITAATDVLRSAVSTTRSTAVSSRKSCSVDIRNSVDRRTTEKISTSAILTSEDFESYDDEKVENIPEFEDKWAFYPDKGTWEIYPQRTAELWVGRRTGSRHIPYSESGYAWSIDTRTSSEPAIDVETTIQARFRARQVTDRDRKWGFGLVANFSNTGTSCSGYRIAVRVETNELGWNTYSRAVIEKIGAGGSPANENSSEAHDTTGEVTMKRELDDPDEEMTAVVAPGVWYWMKLNVKREDKLVTVAGKVWAEGAPESSMWTVGPAYDIWHDAENPNNLPDNFGEGGEPLAGSFCGVWTLGAEMAVDDFSVDWRNTWLLPKGIHMQPKKYDPTDSTRDEFDLVTLDRYEPGSFPLSYRPDGTAASDASVLLVITNIASGDRRAVQIDRNTGRVESADSLAQAD